MIRIIPLAACAAAVSLARPHAFAQSGSVEKAVGGYSFDEAAAEAAGTKDFHSADGHLTFAIVTHTAGNGFFDPVYVGAKVAGNLIGANILLLGSESPIDDPAREIEILNQIVQDPTIDGLIMTTPQVGAYNDIVKAAEAAGIPVATTNSFDGTHPEPQRHQPHRPGRLGGRDRRRGAGRSACSTRASTGGSIVLPSSTAMGNIEVNNRVTSAFNAIVKTLNDAGKLDELQGRRRSGEHRHRHQPERPGQRHRVAVRVARRRGRRLRRQQRLHAGARQGGRADWARPTRSAPTASTSVRRSRRRIAAGDLTGSLGQQPFLQGFWPVMQL